MRCLFRVIHVIAKIFCDRRVNKRIISKDKDKRNTLDISK